jgi:hypothetical protein
MSALGKTGNKYKHTDQERDNDSHDDLWGVNVAEIVGENSGATALNRLKVNDDGSINTSGSSSSSGKATDAYGWSATSDDGTYKYFYFEDASLNYYVMRKHKTNKVATYTKGTGGYSAVYVSSSAGPSGSPTWGTYGGTF